METGIVVVEKVAGKSTVTRCFCKCPLKLIIPTKVGFPNTDAVWIYTLSYGGGLVSGDSICCAITVGDGCTTVLTTQASTKVYKSVGSKCSEQLLEARVGGNALLAVIPDPVTCFATARYSQKQVFRVTSDSSLLIVDWLTSGRHENGEKWDFEFYKSTNNIFLEGDQPLFLDSFMYLNLGRDCTFLEIQPLLHKNYYSACDVNHTLCKASAYWFIGKKGPTDSALRQNHPQSSAKDLQNIIGNIGSFMDHLVLLEQGSCSSIAERMQDYQVIAMVILMGPQLKHLQTQVQGEVKKVMSTQFYAPGMKRKSEHCQIKPALIASCSAFGPKSVGVVVRIAAMTTESVYTFLRHQLASLEPLLGASPYC